MITPQEANKLFRYDPETGLFVRKITTSSNSREGEVVGSVDAYGYLNVSVGSGKNRKTIKLHRLAVLLITGTWPEMPVDHINGDTADNRACNLREVSVTVNNLNSHEAHARSRTGIRGVTWFESRNKFVARARTKGKYKCLGYFDTAEEAGAAYGRHKELQLAVLT